MDIQFLICLITLLNFQGFEFWRDFESGNAFVKQLLSGSGTNTRIRIRNTALHFYDLGIYKAADLEDIRLSDIQPDTGYPAPALFQ